MLFLPHNPFCRELAQLEVKASPAGRLVHYTQNWKKITKDQWVLSTIRGYRIEFHATPNQAYEPHTPKFNQEQDLLIEQKVTNF